MKERRDPSPGRNKPPPDLPETSGRQPINLTELRRTATAAGSNQYWLRAPTLLALIDAVEAARYLRLTSREPVWIGDLVKAQQAFDTALARFTHEPPT